MVSSIRNSVSEPAGGPVGSVECGSGAEVGDGRRTRLWAQRMMRSRALRRLTGNAVAVASALFLLLLVVVALVAPLAAPYDPNATGPDLLADPSAVHWLGTDALGRDTLSRLLFSTGVTLLASLEAVGVALLVGVPLGLVAGHLGRATDSVLSRVFDTLLSLPPLIFALAVIGVLGPGLGFAMLAVGLVVAPRFFRIARVAAENLRHETYIEACRAIGMTTGRIMWRHVLPKNTSGPLLVQTSFAAGLAISAEASLSFLGLGAQLPEASWGSMFRNAFNDVYSNTFQLVPPGLMITLTVLAMLRRRRRSGCPRTEFSWRLSNLRPRRIVAWPPRWRRVSDSRRARPHCRLRH